LIIEIKSVEKIIDVHRAQLLTYMKLSGIGIGLLMNFNVELFKNRFKTICTLNTFVFFVSFVVNSISLDSRR